MLTSEFARRCDTNEVPRVKVARNAKTWVLASCGRRRPLLIEALLLFFPSVFPLSLRTCMVLNVQQKTSYVPHGQHMRSFVPSADSAHCF